MCGLSGAAGYLSSDEEKVVKELLIIGAVRGVDATGIASVNRAGEVVKVAKEIGPWPFLFDTKSFDRVFQGFNGVYIGHNRAATVGGNVRKNAHPFEFENVVGAHNGTLDLDNRKLLKSDYTAYQTDSEALIASLDLASPAETIKPLVPANYGGAWALTWYDKRTSTMNFLRNEHRTLWYCMTADKRTVFWASEYCFLYFALSRNNIKFDESEIKPVPKDMWFSLKIEDGHNKTLDDARAIAVEGAGKKTTTPTTHHHSTHSYHGEMDGMYGQRQAGRGDLLDLRRIAQERRNRQTTLNSTTASTDSSPRGTLYERVFGPKHEQPLEVSGITDLMTPGSTPKQVILTAVDVERMRKWGLEQADIQVDGGLCWLNTDELKIYRLAKKNLWVKYYWVNKHRKWVRLDSRKPFVELPFRDLKPETGGSHLFRHTGKGKHKTIYYKGYKGKNVTQTDFELFMENGCAACDRNPTWGHEVVFLNDKHDFLCEHCELDDEVKRELLHYA